MEHTVITITEYCRYHAPVEPGFIRALAESGLIRIADDVEPALEADELEAVERYARLHYDLGINPEGLEAIAHLLQRVSLLQNEMQRLRAQLGFYGPGDAVEDV